MIAKSIKVAELANKMMERSIITRDTLDAIVNDRKSGLTDSNRMSQLLHELINTVSLKGEIFSWFIETLKDYNTVASQKMAMILEEQYQEVNNIFLLKINIFSHRCASQNHRNLQDVHFS